MHQPLELRSNELHDVNRVLQPHRGHMQVQARAPFDLNLSNPLNGPFALGRQRDERRLPVAGFGTASRRPSAIRALTSG